jgi:membrane protein implicated in regulation of membrane protease activity
MTTFDMIDDVLGLLVGGTAVLLPAFILAVPAAVLLVVPVLVLAAALATVGGVLASPVLLVWALRRRRRSPGRG